MRLSDTSALFTLYCYFVHVVCYLKSNTCLMAHCRVKSQSFWKRTLQTRFFFCKFTFVIKLVISCSIKLGVMEDHSNRTRLAKLLRFLSSNSEKELTSLTEYVERMKEKQDAIYFMAGTSRKEVGIVR